MAAGIERTQTIKIFRFFGKPNIDKIFHVGADGSNASKLPGRAHFALDEKTVFIRRLILPKEINLTLAHRRGSQAARRGRFIRQSRGPSLIRII